MDDTGILFAAVKTLESENPNGEFEAIISTPTKDRKGQTVEAHALEPLPPSIPVFHQHDWREKALPVGRGTPFYEGDVLKMKGYYASSARGQEMRTLVNEGVVDAMSIAFLYKPANVKAIEDGELVTKGELIECSFTATPVNKTALVLASKGLAEKAGARHSATDREHLNTIASSVTALGWECPGCASGAETKSQEIASEDTHTVDEAAAEKATASPPPEVDEAPLKLDRMLLELHQHAAV